MCGRVICRYGDTCSRVRSKNVMVMAFCSMHGDANCDQTVNEDALHIINTGNGIVFCRIALMFMYI